MTKMCTLTTVLTTDVSFSKCMCIPSFICITQVRWIGRDIKLCSSHHDAFFSLSPFFSVRASLASQRPVNCPIIVGCDPNWVRWRDMKAFKYQLKSFLLGWMCDISKQSKNQLCITIWLLCRLDGADIWRSIWQ